MARVSFSQYSMWSSCPQHYKLQYIDKLSESTSNIHLVFGTAMHETLQEYLEKCLDPGNDKEGKKITPLIKDYDDLSKDTTIDFIIYFPKGKLDELEKGKSDYGCNGVEKLLKLYSTSSTSNMHLFDADDKLKKYETVQQIIDDYFVKRLELYQQRKEALIKALEKELVLLSNKAKFIQENLVGTIDLRKKKKEQVIHMLASKSYALMNDDTEYKYLTKMPMDSVTEENVEKLLKDHETKKQELAIVMNTTIYQMWNSELDKFQEEYLLYKEERERIMSGVDNAQKKKMVVNKGIKKVVKKSGMN